MAKRSVAKKRGRSVLASVLVGFVLVGATVVARRSLGIRGDIEEGELKATMAQLRGECSDLNLAIHDHASAAHMIPLAEQRLGLKIPAPEQVIWLRRGKDTTARS